MRHHLAHCMTGRMGDDLVTGSRSTVSPSTIEVARNSRIRIRLINATNARIFGLNIPATAFLIAEDGYPVPDNPTQDVVLAPAQRADFIVDLGTDDVIILRPGTTGLSSGDPQAVDSDKALVSKEVLRQPQRNTTDNDRCRSHSICKGVRWVAREATFDGELRPIRELAQTHKKRGHLTARSRTITTIWPRSISGKPSVSKSGMTRAGITQCICTVTTFGSAGRRHFP